MYESKKKFNYGTGRRKSSVARVRVYENGTGSIIINGRDIDDYFGLETLKLEHIPPGDFPFKVCSEDSGSGLIMSFLYKHSILETEFLQCKDIVKVCKEALDEEISLPVTPAVVDVS